MTTTGPSVGSPLCLLAGKCAEAEPPYVTTFPLPTRADASCPLTRTPASTPFQSLEMMARVVFDPWGSGGCEGGRVGAGAVNKRAGMLACRVAESQAQEMQVVGLRQAQLQAQASAATSLKWGCPQSHAARNSMSSPTRDYWQCHPCTCQYKATRHPILAHTGFGLQTRALQLALPWTTRPRLATSSMLMHTRSSWRCPLRPRGMGEHTWLDVVLYVGAQLQLDGQQCVVTEPHRCHPAEEMTGGLGFRRQSPHVVLAAASVFVGCIFVGLQVLWCGVDMACKGC